MGRFSIGPLDANEAMASTGSHRRRLDISFPTTSGSTRWAAKAVDGSC